MVSDEVIKKVIASMKTSVDIEYFFSKLNKPDWIQPLFDKKLFNEPPEPIVDGGYITTPGWPFSQYLMRMAEHAPEIVAETILKIPNTENERVHQDYIQAALKMPPKYAKKIAINEIKWIRKVEFLTMLYPDYIGNLISYLVDFGDINTAYQLAESILQLQINIREFGEIGTEEYFKDIEVKPKYSHWEYIRLLEKHIPKLITRDIKNYSSLKLVCNLLDTTLEKNNNRDRDYSYIWRPDIGDNEENIRHHEIRDALLVVIRDSALDLIRAKDTRLNEILEILLSFNSIIFERISLYILSELAEVNLFLTEKYLSSKEYFSKKELRVEYARLSRKGFKLLSTENKNIIFSWIDTGPDIEDYREWYIKEHGEDPDQDILIARKKIWQRDRLDQFKEYLEGYWDNYYKELVNEFGIPDSPEYLYKHKSWVGPTSPMTVDEIAELDAAPLVLKLKDWRPSGKSMEPSPEGLSRNLAEAIKTNIDKYKHSASLFKGLPATYIRGVFQGFRDNLSNLDADSWSEIIDLSEWVFSQKDNEESAKDRESDEDPGWSWCKKTVASLLDSGLKKGNGQIPIDLREHVWALILSLTSDPDPTPAHEAEYGGSNMESSTLAINTVRGEAMHALVEYGLWVARNTTDKKISFDDIPEMQQVLDEHLDPEIDPSLAIRSVYGQFFPWLILLDTKWASDAKSRIFSDDEHGLGDAAWDTYITFCQPYDDTFKVIPDIYLKYTKKLSDTNESDDRDRSLEHFVGHIITFYWRSKIELDDEIIQAFYKYAPLNLRIHAIEFIGRSLGNTPGGLDKNIEQRLKALYEWRQSEADKSGEYEELEGFCWWVDANVMDDKEWVLTKFYELLQVLDTLDALDFAARKLVAYLEVDLLKVLECLDLMLDKMKNPGMYFTWDDAAKEILSELLLDINVKEQATDLIHKFGSRGYLNYRDLLTQNSDA